jgi:hypothetical protein
MAVIRNTVNGVETTLRSRNLVGRSPAADIKLASRGASNEHASIVWDGSRWILRDLTSRNGTCVNGPRLTGQSIRLCRGDEVVFGDPQERWVWLDDAPPVARAIDESGLIFEAINGLLLLPNADAPRASVSLHQRQWMLELDSDVNPIEDGAVVTVDGRSYTLQLPSPDPTSCMTSTIEGYTQDASPRISFEVSLDEEYVSITIHAHSESRRLPARAHNYMLLVLARLRLDDKARGIAEPECGWTHTRELARMLNTSVDTLNVDIHRVRHAVSQIGVLGSDTSIVERRRGTGQLRLGIADISL